MGAMLKYIIVIYFLTSVNGFNLGESDVVFHLFTRSNPSMSQPMLPTESYITTSNFDFNHRTVFTIHSYRETVSGNFNAFLVPAHLAVEDVNIVAVDWSVGASMYIVGLGNAPQCGERIASFIDLLISLGYDQDLIRIVGVGLGGHIAGIAARIATAQIGHIISLDPSILGWTHHPDKLNPNDADIVEVLHTTAGSMGYDYPLGDIDFYPNGGRQQKGCYTDAACSHAYAYVFYAESISRYVDGGKEFIGTSCDDYDSAINLQCTGERDIAFGGNTVKTGFSGIYTFETNAESPFAQG